MARGPTEIRVYQDLPLCHLRQARPLEQTHLANMKKYRVLGFIRLLCASFFFVGSGWYLHRDGFHYSVSIRWLSFWVPLWFLGSRAASALITVVLLERSTDIPVPFVSLDRGLPPGCSVLLAMPCLLYEKEQVRRALSHLEVSFLANQDSRLHCALITDHEDGTEQRDDSPSSQALLQFCCDQVRELNKKYGTDDVFHLLHRRQIYASRQRCWMGWERKRGKIHELNALLLGQHSNLEVCVGDRAKLRHIHYVTLIDEGTTVRAGAIRYMVGVLLHPTNAPVWDGAHTRLVSGYGIAQPALVDISANVEIVNAKRKRKMFTQRRDTFQVIYRETNYRGNGLYDVAVFSELLHDRLPENLILSHDIVEGLIVRPIYVPVVFEQRRSTGFDARADRSHRWMRGNWQNLFFALHAAFLHKVARCPNQKPFPLRWILVHKCLRGFDDLALLMLIAGFAFRNPSSRAIYLAIFLWPQAASLLSILWRHLKDKMQASNPSTRRSIWKNLARQEQRTFLRMALLPLTAYIALDACVVSGARLIVGRRLLAWRTSAQAGSDKNSVLQTRSVTSVCLCSSLFIAVCIHLHGHVACATSLSLFWLIGTLFLAPRLRSSLDGNAL